MSRLDRDEQATERLALKLRTLRKRKGMSQTQLGNALGVTFQQVQKYENGINTIASNQIPRLCVELGISPNELFDWDQLPLLGPISGGGQRATQLAELMKTVEIDLEDYSNR